MCQRRCSFIQNNYFIWHHSDESDSNTSEHSLVNDRLKSVIIGVKQVQLWIWVEKCQEDEVSFNTQFSQKSLSRQVSPDLCDARRQMFTLLFYRYISQ